MEVQIENCRSWADVTAAFHSFELPKLGWNSHGGLHQKAWIFRGHKSSSYVLEPSIERAAQSLPLAWNALEAQYLKEFQAKAPLHMRRDQLPPASDKLSWLALMQHHGVPTRLLDFTYSPYIALYFALSDRSAQEASPEVWAVDLTSLDKAGEDRCRRADEAYWKEGLGTENVAVNSRLIMKTMLDPRFAATEHGILKGAEERRSAYASIALDPDPIRRGFFNGSGLVVSALAPLESQRLSNQQGVFLLSGAQELTFLESLEEMMSGSDKWCRRIRFDEQLVNEAEDRLFQMNIHPLSLFPDLEGLAAFVRQKTRLLWGEGPTRAGARRSAVRSRRERSHGQ